MPGAGPHPKDVSKCRSCGADIVWMRTSAGKLAPVNVMPRAKGKRGPNAGEFLFAPLAHESHFATCKEADHWRRK
jgi:hypothetical protein